jgi:acyl-coenzyme A thioesterase PaaI-like protein
MGGPGVIHGGWAAMVFDEVCGLVPLAHDLPPAVTRTLTVNYVKPVPIERLLSVQARLVERRGRDLEIQGELRLGHNGTLLATATAIFTEVSTDHFDKHAAWLASQKEAPTERSDGVGR